MTKTPEYRSRRAITWVLLVAAISSFLVSEAMIAVVYSHGFHPPVFLSGVLNVYTVCLVATVPAVVGLKGFLSLSKSPDTDGITPLLIIRAKEYFLFGVIAAYSIVTLLIQMFAHT